MDGRKTGLEETGRRGEGGIEILRDWTRLVAVEMERNQWIWEGFGGKLDQVFLD